ncbi:hypothetical protein M3697_11160 [Janibacter melonis]|uniref:hypothetical protein n=1 Tax=Janibacter melonis TaxID=262209 RepID=UPI00204363B9|nr:hypothetical protein [Janibacter melonis]MCM3555662.1 hypothetical protein [Janibacter melonis]
MSAALVLPFLVGLLVVLVAVVALVVLVVRSRRRAEDAHRQEHRPLDPSVIECFPTGYQPPARAGAGGAGETAPGAGETAPDPAGPAPDPAGPAPGASTGRRSDDPTG